MAQFPFKDHGKYVIGDVVYDLRFQLYARLQNSGYFFWDFFFLIVVER